MTLDEIVRWIEKDTEDRVLLFELDYVVDVVTVSLGLTTNTATTQTKRFSTSGYTSLTTDSPPNVGYDSCVKEVPRFERSIDRQTLGGRGTMSVGSLVIDNQDGRYDDLLDLACDGSEVRCYAGDRGWSLADFVHLFTAITERLDASDTNTITVQLKDKLSLINASIQTDFIGGTGPNKDRAKPINFGLVRQVECLLEDGFLLLYRYGVEGSLLDVRDRGLSVAYGDNFDGTFTLGASPAGIITADVMTLCGPGVTYRSSDIIEKIASDYLLTNYPAEWYGNITPTTFPGSSTLYGDGDHQLGVRVEEKTNALDVLDTVSRSALTFYSFTRDGRFAYGRIHPELVSTATPDIFLNSDDVRGDVKLEHNDPGYWSYYFYSNKNWHVMSQGDFAGAVTTDDVAKFSAKGAYGSNLDSRPGIGTVVSPDYYDAPSEYHKTMSVSPETETVLSITDADDALTPNYSLPVRWFRRVRNMLFPWMEFVTITVGLRAFYLELGNVVIFNFPRYGFDAVDPATGIQGARFQLVGIDFQLTENQIELVLFRKRGADVTPPEIKRTTALSFGTSTVTGVSEFGSVAHAAGIATVLGITPGPAVASAVGTCTVTGLTGTIYSFDVGGLIYDGEVTDINGVHPFRDDPIHTPVFWDYGVLDTMLVHEDVVDAAVTSPAFVTIPIDFVVAYLPFPAWLIDQSGLSTPFSTSTGGVTPPNMPGFAGQVIDYVTYDPGGNGIDSIQTTVPIGPFSPGDDLVLGPFWMQRWQWLDYSDPMIVISISIIGFYGLPAATGFAYLSVNIQNQSGSMITDVFGSSGAAGLVVELPTNAVDPDAPVGIEYDFSFVDAPNSTTAAPAVCVANDLLGATIDVSGSDRHTLSLKLSAMTLADGGSAQLVFPIKTYVAGLTGWPIPSSSFVFFGPTLVSGVGTTPATTVKTFIGCGEGTGDTALFVSP